MAKNLSLYHRWNEALVKEVLPSAYAEILGELSAQPSYDSDCCYPAFPNKMSTKVEWCQLLQPLFQTHLMDKKVFWTQASGGQWISPRESVFLIDDVEGEEDSDELEAVRDFVTDAGVPLVQLPEPLMATFKKYIRTKTLTPKTVRQLCKMHAEVLKEQSSSAKMALLSYVLSDRDYGDLLGVQLLPLDDGTHEVFNLGKIKIFLDSQEHPKTLFLTGFQGRFVHPDITETIRDHFQTRKLYLYIYISDTSF